MCKRKGDNTLFFRVDVHIQQLLETFPPGNTVVALFLAKFHSLFLSFPSLVHLFQSPFLSTFPHFCCCTDITILLPINTQLIYHRYIITYIYWILHLSEFLNHFLHFRKKDIIYMYSHYNTFMIITLNLIIKTSSKLFAVKNAKTINLFFFTSVFMILLSFVKRTLLLKPLQLIIMYIRDIFNHVSVL